MVKRSEFNLSEAIRAFRKGSPKSTAKEAFEAIKKDQSQKINEGTFKSTFYKLSSEGKRTVKRRKPSGLAHENGASLISHAMGFIRSAGSIAKAREALDQLEAAASEL
jgi:hypothetical protein